MYFTRNTLQEFQKNNLCVCNNEKRHIHILDDVRDFDRNFSIASAIKMYSLSCIYKLPLNEISSATQNNIVNKYIGCKYQMIFANELKQKVP